MFRISNFLKFALVTTVASLAACQEKSPTQNPKVKNTGESVPPTSPQLQKTPISVLKPAYDFERQLQICVGAVCRLDDPKQLSMSDYNPVLIAELDLSQTDTLASARGKISAFYAGIVSSGMNVTTDPKLGLLSAQLKPGNQSNLHEYDIVVRTEGMDNGAHVHDWGARIRCAPVTKSSLWQTAHCK